MSKHRKTVMGDIVMYANKQVKVISVGKDMFKGVTEYPKDPWTRTQQVVGYLKDVQRLLKGNEGMM